MAGMRKTRTGRYEFIIKKAGVLDKPLYVTFDTEAEGRVYCARVEALLAKGILPHDHQPERRVMLIADLVREYERDAHPSSKDRSAFGPLLKAHGKLPLTSINAAWVDAWITAMKRDEVLAPASIRARVGALARCTDWGIRKGHLLLPDNALRNLPDGYAQYTKTDTAHAGRKRIDVERDRRLEPGEFERIMVVIDSGVLPRKQRPLELEHPAALKTLIILAVESAMRLRETYTLTVDQVDVAKRTIFLVKTKNGDKRQVPMSSVALTTLSDYIKIRSIPEGHIADALFPWWDGRTEPRYLHDRSDFLSKLFVKIFTEAGCEDLSYHDLRHEATSRLYERTTLTDLQISKITGHRSLTVLRRYANLRGSDLSARLW